MSHTVFNPDIVSEPAESTLRLRVVSEVHEFRSMASEWDELCAETPDCDVFQSWSWLIAWWKSHGGNYELRLYSVRDAHGKLVGLLPAYLEECKAYGVFRFLRLRYLGTGTNPPARYCDLIARPRDRGRVTRLIAPSLLSDSADWQVLLLENMPAESPLTRRLPTEVPGKQFRSKRQQNAILELPSSWATYLESLESSLRQEVSFAKDRLTFQDSEYRSIEDTDKIRDFLERFSASSRGATQHRFDELGAVFRLVAGTKKCEQVRLHYCHSETTQTPVILVFKWKTTVYCLGFLGRDQNATHSYKLMMISTVIEQAIASGAARCDLSSISDPIIKGFAPQIRETVTLGTVRGQSSSFGGIAAAAIERTARWQRL